MRARFIFRLIRRTAPAPLVVSIALILPTTGTVNSLRVQISGDPSARLEEMLFDPAATRTRSQIAALFRDHDFIAVVADAHANITADRQVVVLATPESNEAPGATEERSFGVSEAVDILERSRRPIPSVDDPIRQRVRARVNRITSSNDYVRTVELTSAYLSSVISRRVPQDWKVAGAKAATSTSLQLINLKPGSYLWDLEYTAAQALGLILGTPAWVETCRDDQVPPPVDVSPPYLGDSCFTDLVYDWTIVPLTVARLAFAILWYDVRNYVVADSLVCVSQRCQVTAKATQSGPSGEELNEVHVFWALMEVGDFGALHTYTEGRWQLLERGRQDLQYPFNIQGELLLHDPWYDWCRYDYAIVDLHVQWGSADWHRDVTTIAAPLVHGAECAT